MTRNNPSATINKGNALLSMYDRLATENKPICRAFCRIPGTKIDHSRPLALKNKFNQPLGKGLIIKEKRLFY